MSNNGNSSPSLINFLRQYRFQKKDSGSSESPSESCESSQITKDSEIPVETTQNINISIASSVSENKELKTHNEFSLKKSNEHIIPTLDGNFNSCNSRLLPKIDKPTETHENADSVQRGNRPKRRRIITDDSDDDSQNQKSKLELPRTQQRQLMDEYEIFSEKERSLRNLLAMNPGSDIMEAQDVLVSCNWNLETAVGIIKEKPLHKMKKFSKIIPDNEDQMVHSDKCVKKDSNLTDRKPEESKDSVSAHKITFNKNVRKGAWFSDDSDDENEPPTLNRVPETYDSQLHMPNFRQSSCTLGSNSGQPPPLDKISEISQKISVVKEESIAKEINLANSNFGSFKKNSSIISESLNELKYIMNTHSSSPLKHSGTNRLQIVPEPSSKSIFFSSSTNSSKVNSVKSTTTQHLELKKREPVQNDNSLSEVASQSRNIGSINASKIIEQSSNNSQASVESIVVEEKCEESSDDGIYENDVCDTDSENENDSNVIHGRASVLSFLQEATLEELSGMPGCSKKKAEIIMSIRPFKSWEDMVTKFESNKYLSTELLNGAKKTLDIREAVKRLMHHCKKISETMQCLVEDLLHERGTEEDDYIAQQPEILSKRHSLAHYQMIGLNWLYLMHKQDVNGILADEMGLGKTIQAIAFLCHLIEQKEFTPHLIVVPSSTLDNWKREFEIWCPSVNVLIYYGSQEERRELRYQILNDEVEDFEIMLTTYNMITGSPEDRSLFKRLEFHYVVFDEAHMLKNITSQRYQHLMRIKAARRLLMTGTPLQNNLFELMSLLIFVMPSIFSGKIDQIKQTFAAVCKTEDNKTKFEKDQIELAKSIMKPFVLRRHKNEVLKELPTKKEEIMLCPLSESQQERYSELISDFSKQVKEESSSGIGMMMQLRKAANHPLLLRNHYTPSKLREMAKLMLKEPSHNQADPNLIFEDMEVMSDFELHRLCKNFKSISRYCLESSILLNSGKFNILNDILSQHKEQGNRVLLFSQFTMMLDIIEEYMTLNSYKYLRLDGSTPVAERLALIDKYNEDPSIFIFLLSTRAGGLGINLTAANVVVIHDIDFNPYNDKQAEDRCHRVGQTKEVKIIKLIGQASIEEQILKRAQEKLSLEKDISSSAQDSEEVDSGGVLQMLRAALGL